MSADVRLAPWSDLPDENGEKTRTIYYTLSINYAIGPKCSPSTERQVRVVGCHGNAASLLVVVHSALIYLTAE